MKNITIIFFLIFLICGNSAYTHSIDDKEAMCIANTSDTQEMNKCSKIAQKSWEKEIEKNINELKKILDKTACKSLIKSQKIWLKHKNQEFSLIQRIINNKQGTMYLNVEQGLKTDLLKQRAVILQEYVEIIKD